MSKIKEFLANLDKGFYREARVQGLTAGAFLAEKIDPEPDEVQPAYERVLKKHRATDDGGYFAGRLYQHAAETVALGKCLQERGIRVRAPHASRGEKFFGSATDTALFPAFISNRIQAGILATSLAERLVATDEMVTTHSVEKVTLDDTAEDRTLKFTGEGANMPKTKIVKSEGIVKLYKYGRVLEYTYESARLMRVNLIALFLERMGAQMGIDQTDDLIETLIAGDGTTGSAITDSNDLDAEVSGTLDFDELIRINLAFSVGYRATEVIVADTLLRTALNLAELKDPQAGYRIAQDGPQEFQVMGARWNRWTSAGAPSFASDNILAVDTRNAVGVLREGDFLEESDRIIDRQLNQTAMSEWVGYQKLDNAAVVLYDGTA